MELNDSATGLLLATTLISAVILLALWSPPRGSSKKKKKLPPPPGPWRLPLIGNLLNLATTSQPHVALRDLAMKHGPVMSLRLGQIYAVVISSPAAAQEVLRDKDLAFASRPSLLVADIILYGSTDVSFAPYGAYWRMLRRLCNAELLSTHKVRQLAAVRDTETLSLVRKVCHCAGESGQPVNLSRLVLSCSLAITGRATFGQLYCGNGGSGELMSVVDVAVLYGGGFCAGDLFPSLWFVDVVTGLTRRLWRARRHLDAMFDRIIAECEMKTATTAGDDDESGGGLLSALLRVRDEGEPETGGGISTTSIKAILFDMLAGGTETTSSAAEWIMSELMRNPEAMARAQAEVRGALDAVKHPKEHEGHMDKLRFTRMVVKEGLRLHPVFPLLLPRLCRETCDVGGFEVAKGTKVIINAWALARSPEQWQDPEEFRPERFAADSSSCGGPGAAAADYVGSRFEYIPFGSGRRMCPGNTFGLAALELIVVRLLYYFDWSLPNGMRPEELDMDTVVGSTMRRRNHLQLLASPYKEITMQL